MSNDTGYKLGSVLKNSVGQYTKVISLKNGVYGISGWTTKKNAEKATVATQFMNRYGLKYAGVTVEKAGADKAKAPAKSASKASAPKKTAPKKVTPKKVAPKKKSK